MPILILHIAIATPLRHCLDYLSPQGIDSKELMPGLRIWVPFGRKRVIGIILAVNYQSCVDPKKLKSALGLVDQEPILPDSLFALKQWASDYYQHPIGEVMLGTLPQLLRQGRALRQEEEYCWQTTQQGQAIDLNELKRAPRQAALLNLLRQHGQGLSPKQIRDAGFQDSLLKGLLEKGLIISVNQIVTIPHEVIEEHNPVILNHYQQQAIEQVGTKKGFQTFLLEGVTGSGKTEVYMQAITQQLKAGNQALVLVPEIGLTPQTIHRFQQRFPVPIVVLHSGLSERERFNAWLQAREGIAKIIIGTRSAIFTPLRHPGIIILDEEHDASFKQQSGFRYSARDLAIVRGRLEATPVILGTATPSLESLGNVKKGRFVSIPLPERVGNAMQPSFHIIDIRNQNLDEGISPVLLQAMQGHLAAESQVLLFLNRRGYAPVLICHSCGWAADCRRCDARLTLHHSPSRLICHHCGATHALLRQCKQCQSPQLYHVGLGTERLEQTLRQHFPNAKLLRIDRDTTRRKGTMEDMLESIRDGHGRILIGTQMLAKGHHFPNVTLVGIIDADSGLYSADFRATERMAQLIVQVAGRAGRAEKPGQVFLQTHNPDHPLLRSLLQQGYSQFAAALLQERQQADWPPFSCLALLRAEAVTEKTPIQFLEQARQAGETLAEPKINLLGPIPAPMERKAGRYRALLLIQSSHRPVLQKWLNLFMNRVHDLKFGRKVRWSLDVDPLEMF